MKTPAGMSRAAFKDKVLDQAVHLPACQTLPSNHRLSEQIGDLLRRKESERHKGVNSITLWPYLYDKEHEVYTETPLQLYRVLKDSELAGTGKANNYGRFYFAYKNVANEMVDFVWIEDSELSLSGALQSICPPAMHALLMSARPKNLWPENIKHLLDVMQNYKVQQNIERVRSNKRRRTDAEGLSAEVAQAVEDMADEMSC